MDTELLGRLKAQDEKLEAIFRSTEKTRKYFLVTAWVTILAFVLPLVGLLFAIPAFIDSYTTTLGGL